MMSSRKASLQGKGHASLLMRHWHALGYVLTIVLPTILRTGKRPVIFNKYSGIGDIVCTIPAALELKKRHSGVEFIYNCHPDYACLPRLGGVTDRTTSSTDIGVVGYWYGWLLSGFYQFGSDDDRPDKEHGDIYIKDFGRAFGIELDGAHPRLRHEAAVMDRMRSLLKSNGLEREGFIVIHTGPTWPVKEWPHDTWETLVQKLRLQGDVQIIRLGTSSHLAIGEVAQKEILSTISLMDQLTLEESAALIELSDLFVGVDSGLLHIAIAAGTPAVGLWGATSARFLFSEANRRLFVVSKVECQGCHHRVPRLHWITGCPFDIKCMKEIGVAEVLQMCREGLKASGKIR